MGTAHRPQAVMETEAAGNHRQTQTTTEGAMTDGVPPEVMMAGRGLLEVMGVGVEMVDFLGVRMGMGMEMEMRMEMGMALR